MKFTVHIITPNYVLNNTRLSNLDEQGDVNILKNVKLKNSFFLIVLQIVVLINIYFQFSVPEYTITICERYAFEENIKINLFMVLINLYLVLMRH